MSHSVHTIGTLLENRRKSLGLTIQDVAKAIKIRPQYLHALEQGDTAIIAIAAYNIGYIRLYAHFLGLNGEMLITQLKEANAALQNGVDLHVPERYIEDNHPNRSLVIFCFILLLSLYTGWYSHRQAGYDYRSQISEISWKLNDFSFLSTLSPPPPAQEMSAESSNFASPMLLTTDIGDDAKLSLFSRKNNRITLYFENGAAKEYYMRKGEWLFIYEAISAIAGNPEAIEVHKVEKAK